MDEDCHLDRAWLRVSDEASDEHHLVNLSKATDGSFVRIFPKKSREERATPRNHWLPMLRALERAHSGMCSCCQAEHSRWQGFGEFCTILHSELREVDGRYAGCS